jgi:hypothetical protein
MKTEKRIALACFIGATIGALLALQFNHHFWWVGVFVGGLVGYVGYNFHEIPATAQKVWRQMPERKQVYEFVKDHSILALASITALAPLCGFVATVMIGLMSLLNTCDLAIEIFRHYKDVPFISPTNNILFYVGGSSYMLVVALILFGLSETKNDCGILAVLCLVFAPAFTPVIAAIVIAALAIVIPCGICYGIYYTVKTFWKVPYRTFVLVHSEMRLLCMTDAMIGALAGYYFGNALVGGIVGAFYGVLNYRLVSVKLLKLVKA